MPVDEEGGGGGGGLTFEEKVVAWLNGVPRKNVPDGLNRMRNKQGLFDRFFLDNVDGGLRRRLIGVYRDRKEPGLAFRDWRDNDDIGPRGGSGDGSDGPAGPLEGGGPGTGGGGRRNRGGDGGGRGGNGRRGGNGPQLKMEELAADYGWSLAFLNSKPELKRLFKEAVKKTWSPERFVAELRDTDWFKNHSATARQFMVNRIVDPATWQSDLERTKAHTNNVWGSLFGVQLGEKLQEKWAIRAMRNGWTDEQIADHIVQSVNFQKLMKRDTLGGSAAQTQGQIQQMAAAYGVHPGRGFMARNVERILAGADTIDGTMDRLKDMAKSRYRAFADEIEAGRTMDEIASPYVQTMAELLELNPEQLNVRSGLVQKALTNTAQGKDGKKFDRPLSITEFEDVVRKDSRWMRTQQANDQFEQLALNLATTWGLA